ncbi:MAG: hypothetical protein R6U98_22295, partial [Pirellulaceae bacterium]
KLAEPRRPIPWKEFMMPQTVPKRPINGVALEGFGIDAFRRLQKQGLQEPQAETPPKKEPKSLLDPPNPLITPPGTDR